MLSFNRILIYTHKFDRWQYIVSNDYEITKFSILENLQTDEASILNYINTNQSEIAYYYTNGNYYRIISTSKDLLQHIEYIPKDNRKHEMNRGFYEWKFSISDLDTIPIKLVEFAFKIYFDGKYNCEVDLSQIDCSLDNENISKFLYVANGLLNLNVFYKVYDSELTHSKTSLSDSETITIQDIKSVISDRDKHQTYLKVFYYNIGNPIKLNVIGNVQNSETLRWILNSSQEVLNECHEYINTFIKNSGVSINRENIWNFIDNYSINNSCSLNTVINLEISLDDMISIIINTKYIEESLYNKYIYIIESMSYTALTDFLSINKNQEYLEKVYQKISTLRFQNSFDLENFTKNLNILNLIPSDINIMLYLIKSMCLSKKISFEIIFSVLKNQYRKILSNKNILDENNLVLLENIGNILQFKYPKSISINVDLKEQVKKYYQDVLNSLMSVNIVSIEKNSKFFHIFTYDGKLRLNTVLRYNRSFFKKVSYNLDTETFEKFSRFSEKLFWIHNPDFNFSKLSSNEKVLILTNPELLLTFIDFCDETHNESLLKNIFYEDNTVLNIGLLQVECLKYIIYQKLEDGKVLMKSLDSLGLGIQLKVCKDNLKILKKSLKNTLDIHDFSI